MRQNVQFRDRDGNTPTRDMQSRLDNRIVIYLNPRRSSHFPS